MRYLDYDVLCKLRQQEPPKSGTSCDEGLGLSQGLKILLVQREWRSVRIGVNVKATFLVSCTASSNVQAFYKTLLSQEMRWTIDVLAYRVGVVLVGRSRRGLYLRIH